MLALGLMSGTSADGVDSVLAEFKGSPNNPQWTIRSTASIAYPDSLRRKVLDVGQGLPLKSSDWLELLEAITEVNSEAAKACDPKGYANVIGCHGQTVWHRTPSQEKRGASLQLLQPQLLAALLNKPVISDFRAADLALGGQGAPLVPILDAAILGRIAGWRAVLNIGGISNLSLIPPSIGPNCLHPVLGWDCGPGNTLLDFASQKVSHGALLFDEAGKMAAQGVVDESIIHQWLKEPYFQKSPPKSTGREQFGIKDFQSRLDQVSPISPEDLLATLAAFTAAIVVQDLENLQANKHIYPIELVIAGGGCRNPVILKEINSRSYGMRTLTIDKFGIPIEIREALAFALLAYWHILLHPADTSSITGSSRSAVLGIRTDPP